MSDLKKQFTWVQDKCGANAAATMELFTSSKFKSLNEVSNTRTLY
jgi:hypothetical protein